MRSRFVIFSIAYRLVTLSVSSTAIGDEIRKYTWNLIGYPRWGTCDEVKARVRADFERASGRKALRVNCETPFHLGGPSADPPYNLSVEYLGTEPLQIITTDTDSDGYHPAPSFQDVTIAYGTEPHCYQDLFGNHIPPYSPDFINVAAHPTPLPPFLNLWKAFYEGKFRRSPPEPETVLHPNAPMNQVKRFYQQIGIYPAVAFCYPVSQPMDTTTPWNLRIEAFAKSDLDENNFRPFVFSERVAGSKAERTALLARMMKAINDHQADGRHFVVARGFLHFDLAKLVDYVSILYYGNSHIEFQDQEQASKARITLGVKE
jgi:hypothetical protein